MPCQWSSSCHVLAVHSSKPQVKQDIYLQWWAEMWRQLVQVVEPVSVLSLADTSSAPQPEDRSKPWGENPGYHTYLGAFDLRDFG